MAMWWHALLRVTTPKLFKGSIHVLQSNYYGHFCSQRRDIGVALLQLACLGLSLAGDSCCLMAGASSWPGVTLNSGQWHVQLPWGKVGRLAAPFYVTMNKSW